MPLKTNTFYTAHPSCVPVSFLAPKTGLRSEDLTLMLIGLCYNQRFWGPVKELPRRPAGICRFSHRTKGSFMKLFLAVASAALFLTGSTIAQQPTRPGAAPAPGLELRDLKQKASYGYGYSLGKNLKAQGVEIDADLFARGLVDALGGNPGAMKDEEIQATLQEFARQLQARQAGMAGNKAASNKLEGERFLAANKSRPGVTTLPSGLQFKVMKQGSGPKPKATDTVTVHYEGKLIDGTIFDSSLKRGQPASFGVNQVIAGWTEALQLMPVGSTWELYIPSNLAYGERPRPGGPIGPNAVLTFEVQLLKIGQ